MFKDIKQKYGNRSGVGGEGSGGEKKIVLDKKEESGGISEVKKVDITERIVKKKDAVERKE